MQAAVAVKAMLEAGNAPPELLLEQEVLAARRNGLDGATGVGDDTGLRDEFRDELRDELGPVEEWAACPQCDAPIPPGDAPCPPLRRVRPEQINHRGHRERRVLIYRHTRLKSLWPLRPLWLVLCCGAFLPLLLNTASASPLAQETISIRGKVVNGTAGIEGPIVQDDGGSLAVLMLITGPDGTLSGTGQTQAAPDGSFVLNDAPVVEGGVYNLSVDYGGVFYGRSLTADDLPEEVVITVHEATEDATIMRVERQVMVISEIDAAERMVTATEFVRFTNPTDRTLRPNLETARPGMFSFMRFALPPDAADVRVQSNLSGGEIISVGSGFALAAPVPPGQHSVDFAYTFPYEGGSLEFRNSLPQGADIFQILVPERWPGVAIGGLTPTPACGHRRAGLPRLGGPRRASRPRHSTETDRPAPAGGDVARRQDGVGRPLLDYRHTLGNGRGASGSSNPGPRPPVPPRRRG